MVQVRSALPVPLTVFVLIAALTAGGCNDARREQMEREAAYMRAEKEKEKNAGEPAEVIPADPMRDSLNPVLSKIYSGSRMPDVLEAEVVSADERFQYSLVAGALAKIKVQPGLTQDQRIRAIVLGVAESDAWVHRGNARRDYAEHVQRIKNSFGEEQKQKVMRAYADLKLLDFFNSADAEAAIGALPADLKPTLETMRTEYVSDKQAIWQRWMDVKMYARREVAGDVPFKDVLKKIREELGQAEPPAITLDAAHDDKLLPWAKEIEKDEKLLELLTNLPELRDREEFKSDTHAMWLMEGSPKIPEKARKVKIEDDLGFGVYREDLGGGYQELIFVFSKKLSGPALKHAYVRSHIYRHIFSDFQLLATAGTDFTDSIVPDKYDPEYARCASLAAVDVLIEGKREKHAFLADLTPAISGEEAQLNAAHKCIIERCAPDIHMPDKEDKTDVQGPAPSSRLAFFQMTARFQDIDVDMAKMKQEREKPQDVQDAEAFLKANRNTQN